MNDDRDLVIAKLYDKIRFSKSRNKVVHTEFLSAFQMEIIQKELNRLGHKSFFFFGGYEGAEGRVLVLFPDKLGPDIARESLIGIIKVIRVILPKELKGKFSHRHFLGAVMRSGLNRDRVRRYYCV